MAKQLGTPKPFTVSPKDDVGLCGDVINKVLGPPPLALPGSEEVEHLRVSQTQKPKMLLTRQELRVVLAVWLNGSVFA